MIITKKEAKLGDKKTKCPECKVVSYIPTEATENILLNEAYIVECAYCGWQFRTVKEK